MSSRPHILCFTDVLCGHSYFAHARFARLAADFGDRVRLTFHFRSTYGDVRGRIAQSGKSEADYAAMVRAVAARFDHVTVHPDIFRERIPTSSQPAHVYLRAVKILEDDGALDVGRGSPFERMIWEVQLAFFRDLIDVSRRAALDQIAQRLELPIAEIARVIDDGRAFAELDRDAKLERRFNVQMSPALVLDEGRQVLNGNVGYGVIEANVRELLSSPPATQSSRV